MFCLQKQKSDAECMSQILPSDKITPNVDGKTARIYASITNVLQPFGVEGVDRTRRVKQASIS